MDRRVRVWTLGSAAAATGIAPAVLDLLVALHADVAAAVPTALRILLFVAFGTTLANLASVAYFATHHVSNLNSHALGGRTRAWSIFAAGVVAAAVSGAVSGVAIVWLVIQRSTLPRRIVGAPHTVVLVVWLGLWAATVLLHLVLFGFLAVWARAVLRTQRASRLDLDFGIRVPSMAAVRRPSTRQSETSFGSQEPTLHSPPRTPVSRGDSSTRRSSSTRVGTASSRTKLVRHSNRSSFESSPFQAAAEARHVDSAFDHWDTSSVHHEMRVAIHPSPPVTHSGLETIPGSRPESPANALDGPFLPESAEPSSSPHATTAETAAGWSSSPRQPSSPPSSPPNFSRPTSAGHGKPPPPPPSFEPFDASMHDLIHPLFRPNSPQPPPTAMSGTMVTASPLASEPLTPRTLARLRSHTVPATGHWRAMPSIDRSETQSPESSLPESPTLPSPSLGSPGPSIVDEAELPPILPGFVLSAGSRSSLVGYGKRKSLKKERPKSQLSVGSRLSGLLM